MGMVVVAVESMVLVVPVVTEEEVVVEGSTRRRNHDILPNILMTPRLHLFDLHYVAISVTVFSVRFWYSKINH
jgi:hypothetical protein